jgi:serine/threonine-protein kinase
MSDHSSAELGMLTLSEAERIDRVCDRFEAAWRAGEWPCIEAYLDAVAATNQGVLLRELLELEIELRLEAGEHPTASEYKVRFAEQAKVVDECFARDRVSGEVRPTLVLRAVEPNVSTADQATAHVSTRDIDPGRADELREMDGALGRIVGDYHILERIGRGGMGVVYRALQRSARRIVALKLIKADWSGATTLADHRDAEIRFLNEAQAHARLEHDHIVPVYDVGHADGLLFFSMRLIKGRSLSQILRSDGPLPPRRAAYYMEAIARAIQYAHDHKILHRDPKPSNVMVDEHDRPYLIDLGLAKCLEETDYTTVTGKPLGTAEFMSPEQARGDKEIGFASDVYGLGATLFALLTGRPPFTGPSMSVVLRKVIDEEPVWPRARDKSVGPELKGICLKCLEKDAAKRFRSAGELAEVLNKYLNYEDTGITAPGLATRLRKWIRRNPWRAAAAGIAIMAAAAVTWLGAWGASRDRALGETLVYRLLVVPFSDVPATIDQMAGHRGWIDPLLHRLKQNGPATYDFRTRIALALLPSEPERAPELVDRLLAAGPDEHKVIREALRGVWPTVAPRLVRIVHDLQSDPTRRSRAAAALIALDGNALPANRKGSSSASAFAAPAWSLLRFSPVPDARTDLLDWLVHSRVDLSVLADRFEREPDVSIRRILLQAIGGLGEGRPPAGASAALADRLATMYRDDPDPGIHSSAAYALRRWGQAARVKAIDDELAGKPRGGKGWYVNSIKMTMVVLDTRTDSGQDLRDDQMRPYRFAIASTETTLGQLRPFDPQHADKRAAQGALPETNPDAPADVISYYEAARFCNWLSEHEGIPKSEWCYEPETGVGVLTLAPDYLSLRGYRLPTVPEWEFAARGGTVTDRYFGESEKQMGDYAWAKENTRVHSEPVGRLRPNDFGLFDVIGNVMEWCYNPDPPHDENCDCKAKEGKKCEKVRLQSLKGGTYSQMFRIQGVLNKNRVFNGFPPHLARVDAGFRVVKREP